MNRKGAAFLLALVLGLGTLPAGADPQQLPIVIGNEFDMNQMPGFDGFNPNQVPDLCQHVMGVWEIDIPATCMKEGTKVRRCTLCGKVMESGVLPKEPLNHAGPFTIVEKFPPTCDADGLSHKVCACGVPVEGLVIPATGHTPGDWKTIEAATTTKEGKKTRSCTVCGQVLETKTIPKLAAGQPGPPVILPPPAPTAVPAATLSPADDSGGNLILNGMFDQGIAYWAYGWDAIQVNQYGGYSAAYLAASMANRDIMQTIANLRPSTAYTLSFQLLGIGTINAFLAEKTASGVNTAIPAEHAGYASPLLSGLFTPCTLSFTTQPDCACGILCLRGIAGSTLMVTDVRLQADAATAAWPPPLQTSTAWPPLQATAVCTSSPTQPPGSAQYRTLQYGDRDPDVAKIRKRLYELGYYKHLYDGELFTESMADIVAVFQERNGLPADGVATPETQAVMFSVGALKK